MSRWKNEVGEWVTPNLDHMPGPTYLRPTEMKWRQDTLSSCNFCSWIARIDSTVTEERSDWVIWVTEHGQIDTFTGLPEIFKVYVRCKPRNSGFHGTWKGCYEHAYTAYLDCQQIMLDELHDWEKTDRWMRGRMGRI